MVIKNNLRGIRFPSFFSVIVIARNVLFLKEVEVTMGIRGKIMKYDNTMLVYRTKAPVLSIGRWDNKQIAIPLQKLQTGKWYKNMVRIRKKNQAMTDKISCLAWAKCVLKYSLIQFD